jgi:hypothetical protein
MLTCIVGNAGQVYRCVDGAGKVSFGQVPCGGVLPSNSGSAPGASPAPYKVAGVPDQKVRIVYPAPEGSEAKATAAIASKLKDPDSLQVRNLTATGATADPSEWIICGEYNARNSFGGYVGFHKFSIVDGQAFLGSDDIESIMVNATCK